jgi:hypothetical protein
MNCGMYGVALCHPAMPGLSAARPMHHQQARPENQTLGSLAVLERLLLKGLKHLAHRDQTDGDELQLQKSALE